MAETNVYKCVCGQMGQSCGSVQGYPGLQCSSCKIRWWHTSCWKCRQPIDGRHAQQCPRCKYWHCPEPNCGVCSRGCAGRV